MARKIVDIGVEGNDGTGDSIREAFRKTNDNFKELYAVFGQEGTISFLDLGDTPNSYTNNANKITIVNTDGTGIEFKELIGTAGLEISYPTEGENAGKIVFENRSNSVENDLTPQLSGALNARGQVLGYVGDPTPSAVAEFNSKYGYSGSAAISADQFAINRKYADNRYVNLSGDVMTGHLSVPAGATNNQVPRASETVLKAGSAMTGTLYLNDHPGELAGAGTPSGADDLQAATKYYVDNTSYSSKVNLYVSTNGDDSQTKTPPGREGRHWTYAYRTVGAACLRAEQLIKDSPWELGPYRQMIAYGNGATLSQVQAVQPNRGLNGTLRIRFDNDSGRPVDQGVVENRDIIPGKMIVGRTSGARGFIVRYDTDGPQDYVDLRDVTGTFQVGENLEFDQAVKRLEISIFVESGTYLEDFPIKIPQNVSILGDEFRRTVIRPADRPSRSPWVTAWFYRDTTFDGLEIAETNWGYHYLTDPTNKASLPKNNKELDVFLCNDATIIRQISCQGHGGFMMVLDPEGQILTKSPYAQQSGCFSGSINKQRFAGGQYVDGQAGSMPVSIVSMNADNSEVTISDAFRTPQTPTAFYVKGQRYKVDTFTDTGEGYRSASELLANNRSFIIAETIAYVNDVITPTFTYDQAKCSRDVGLILNAVAWDLAFDTNIQTVLAAQEYFYKRNGDPYTLLPTQQQATLDALNYVKEQLQLLFDGINTTAYNRVTALMDTVIAVVEGGLQAVPARTMTAPPAPLPPATNTDIVDSLNILLANREFIKAEYIAYFINTFGDDFLFGQDPITNEGAGISGYQRDADRMINAVIYDAIYGGNSQSSLVARSFYDIDGNLLIANEVTEIVQAIDHIKAVARDVVLNLTVDYKQQYATSQVFGTPGSAVVSNTVVNLFDNLKAVIVSGISAGELISYPDLTNVSSGIKDAKNSIDSNSLSIRSSTIEFINSRYLYNQFAAELDIGFIVDAVAHDILYTGNLKTVEHSLSYFVGDATLVSEAEKPRTLAIVNYIEQLMMLIVDNIDVPSTGTVKRRQFAIPQTIQLTNVGTGPVTIEPSLAWVDSSLVTAAQLLESSTSVIVQNIISYLDTTYGTTYDRVKSQRELTAAVEALRYDLMFGSNFRSIKVGMEYYRTPVSSGISAVTHKAAMLAAITQLRAQASAIVNDIVLARTRVESNSDVIYNIVNNGIASAPAFVTPNPTTYDAGYLNARRLITANKSFIIAELTAWIEVQKAGNITPFTSTFVYDQAKCERDVGYIVDALQYDLTYGGNLETLVAANAYFIGAVSQLGNGEREETLATYEYLRTIIDDIARGVEIVKSAGNSLTQDISGTSGSIAAAEFAQARIGEIYSTIDTESVNSKPRVTELIGTIRDVVSGTTYYTDARDLLVANRDFIKAEVTNYIDYKYSVAVTASDATTDLFTTASTANLRVGMPVEFVGADPFEQVITTASGVTGSGPFFVTFEFARQQTAPTVGIEYEILNNSNANYNVIATATDSTTNSITLQFVSDPGEWGVQSVSSIRVASGTFGGIIRGQKYYVKQIASSTTFSVTSSLVGGVTGAVVPLVTATGNMKCTLAYNRKTCARDVGFIVSNISTDILYGGRYNSIRAGLRYWASTAETVVGEQSPETLDGINYINTLAQMVIANQTYAGASYQSLNGVVTEVEQVVIDTLTNGAAASTAISGLVGVIYNIVASGAASAPSDAIMYPKYVLQLNEETYYSEEKSGPIPDSVIIQSAGNTSMLSNDWTQLNDLGYGLVATNNGLIETVSVFTYYCWAAYYANNGGQIRAVGGSNAHGEYGLIAEGSDPFEVPDDVNLADDMVQVGVVYKAGPFAAEMVKDKTNVYLDNYGYLPYNVSEIEINHGYGLSADGAVINIGATRYEISNISDVSSTVFSAVSITFGSKTAVSGGYNVVLNFPTKTFAPEVGRKFTVAGNSNTNYNGEFECVASTTSSITLKYLTDPGTFGSGATSVRLKAGSIIRLNLNTGGNNNTSTTGLQKELVHGQSIIIRSNQNFKFYNADRVNPTRPSTALTFRGDPVNDAQAPVYRVLSFNTRDPLSRALVTNDPVRKNEVILTFDSGYDYIDLVVATDYATLTEAAAGIEGGSSTRTLGSKAGDKFIAIEKITSSRDLARIQTGEMVFAWNGRVHRVVSYTLKQISSIENYGIIELSEQRPEGGAYQSVLTTPATGITSPVKPGIGYVVSNASYSAGYVTFTIPLQDSAPANGSYTVYGNNNTAYNITATSSGNTTSTIRLPLASDPGVFEAGSVTRIFPASTLYNPELVDGNTVSLKTGLSKGENADIIVNISTCRATSHDFLDIGSGGYNQTNYPNKVYGAGRQKSQKKEVVERTTGRVFWVSTDQDGFFRVGRFFTVDQGTGTVSFAASLALSNLDGLGFKRGRAISEFSDDDTFQDLAQDTVPTEGAVDGYLNRRLGIDRNGTIISDGTLGPGFLDRDGILPATGNINMGSNRLVNLASPASDTDAVNKSYVDGQELSDVRVNTANRLDNDLLTWNSDTGQWVNAKTSTANSQIQADLVSEKELNLYVKRETISNSQISADADIDQSKLDINVAAIQRDQGVKFASVTTSSRIQATGVTITGKSPNVLVKINLGTALAVAPVTGIYYTVQGNSNTKFNGAFYCVDSTSGAASSVTLVYPENPGTFATDATTYVTAHTTEITTQLPHALVAGDTVSISGTTGNTILNREYPVLSVGSTTKFTVPVNTYGLTITVTSARATKVGLAAFNKNQFDVVNGFVGFKGSASSTFTANIAAGSAVITNISSMDNISVGSVITLQANFGSVAMPVTTAGSNPTAISQALPVTVTSIDSATQITVSRPLAGSGTANGATLNVIYGIPLSSIQQIPTDRIVGNLSGSTSSPNVVTSSEVVEAGDGIKNAEFNGSNRIGYSNNNTTVLPDSSTDLNIHGLMALRAIGTNSWQNTYGVFKVTRSGEGNSIVRTNAAGEIDSTAYLLDGKLALDSAGSANIDMYTPGGAKFLSATGTTTNPNALTVNVGVLNESSVLSGTVTVPKLTAINTVTMNPANASISMQPTGTGSIVINPASVGSIDNMAIGTTIRSSGRFTTLTANDSVTLTSANESSSTSTGALVVSGGVGIAKNVNVGGSITIAGNLTVNGITTTVNSASLAVDDKNIELASVGTISPLSGTIDSSGVITDLVDSTGNAPSGLIQGMILTKISGTGAFGTSPTIGAVNSQNSITVSVTGGTFTPGTITFSAAGNNDTTADGGGITLKGTTDKTIIWSRTSDRWTSNVGFEAASIQNTPIGSTDRSTGAFTTLAANDAVTLTKDADASSSTAGGTLTVTGGAAISRKLFVGGATTVNNTLLVTNNTVISDVSDAAYSGTGPYTFTDGALRVQGGAVVEKKLVVFGATTLLGGATISGTLTGKLTGSASQVDAVTTTTNSVFYPTFVNSNNGTAAGESVYTGTGLKFNPSTNVLETTTFKGNLDGQAVGADTVKVVNANNVNDSTYYITFVADDNAVGSAANEVVYSDTSLTFNPSTNTLFAGSFNGALIGNADTASQVKTTDAGAVNAQYYLTFVDSNNASATAETVYTDSAVTINPSTSAITASSFNGTFVGVHKGNIQLDDGTALLTRGATAASSTFAGNAATANKWATGVSIELLGAVTGTVTGVDGSNNIFITTTLGGAIAAASADKLKVNSVTTTDGIYYPIFSDGAGGTLRDISADTGTGGMQYNPATNTLSCAVFSGTATQARYADLAENYLADKPYEPGTVVVFGGEREVTANTAHNDRRVAGVVSTNPAHLMNADLTGDYVVALALQGRVPCKVVGPVAKGDLLVTSAKPGYAIVNNDPKVGTVIGKAVGVKTDLGEGVVEVVVGRL